MRNPITRVRQNAIVHDVFTVRRYDTLLDETLANSRALLGRELVVEQIVGKSNLRGEFAGGIVCGLSMGREPGRRPTWPPHDGEQSRFGSVESLQIVICVCEQSVVANAISRAGNQIEIAGQCGQ